MGSDNSRQITDLRRQIALLQLGEKRLHSIIASALTPAGLRDQAKLSLEITLEKLKIAADELTRLEQHL